MLDPNQILQDVEELLDTHYTAIAAVLPRPPAPAAPQPAHAKATGVTELLGNLAFLFVLAVLDKSLARPSTLSS